MLCLCLSSLLSADISSCWDGARHLSMLRYVIKIRINALMCILRKDFMTYLLPEWFWWDLLLCVPARHSFLKRTKYHSSASWRRACWVLPFNKIEYTVICTMSNSIEQFITIMFLFTACHQARDNKMSSLTISTDWYLGWKGTCFCSQHCGLRWCSREQNTVSLHPSQNSRLEEGQQSRGCLYPREAGV